MPLCTEVDLGPGHVVLNGDPALPSEMGTSPNFGQILLGQMAGWIKKPLGMELGLGPGD